jgi:TP901 family phage tail tape measure protein
MSRFVLTAQLQLQAPNNVQQVVRQIQQQLQGVTVNVQVQGTAQAQRQIQQVTQQTNQATTAAERMGRAFSLSVRRFAAFSVANRAVGLFTSTLSNAVDEAIKFERQLIKVAQVAGKSVNQLKGLTKEITNLATGFGVASSDLLGVSTTLIQAGLSANDTSVALKTLAKAALAPNFDSISETAEGAIAILAQFQQGVGALENQLGSINAVAGAFAVEAGDLIEVIRKTGGVFKASGGSLNELLALFTSVRATTRESAESISTGLRTIFTRIQRPKTIEFLKQFGVELVDLNGKFVGPFEAIRKLSEALSGLGEGDLTFIRIAEELGGFRQIGKVLPLLQQFTTAQSALNVAQKAGSSLTDDAAKAQLALSIRITKVKEEFQALIRSVTETTTFQVMANTALSLASALIKIGEAIKPLLPLLAAVAAVKFTQGIGTFIGGALRGATSGRAYSTGGKVHHFARGGVVPGTGNRDTVPAMLQPGEFVIRKSSVNKIGTGNLAAMNENKYAAGGIVKNNRSMYGAKKSWQDVQNQYPSLTENQARRVVNGTKTIAAYQKTGVIEKTEIQKNAEQKKKGFAGRISINPSAIGGFFLRPNKGTERDYNIRKRSVSLSDGKYELSGNINGFYTGKNDIAGGTIGKIVSRETKLGLKNSVISASNAIRSSKAIDVPPIDGNETIFEKSISNLFKEGGAQTTVEGYMLEGIISALSGATLAGGQTVFDYPSSSFTPDVKQRLGSIFRSTGDISKLVKADAKRTGNPNNYKDIGNKLVSDIKKGNTEGVTVQKFAVGGEAQKVAAMMGKGKSIADSWWTGMFAGNNVLFDWGLPTKAFKIPTGEEISIDQNLRKVLRDRAQREWLAFADQRAKERDAKKKPVDRDSLSKYNLTQSQIQKSEEMAKAKKAQDYVNRTSGFTRDVEDYGRRKRKPEEYMRRFRGYATGGDVGTDTVPALLTPGEFVINKKSAQNIGYGSLNRMNKVGKYAKGGVVQKFAKGTSGTGAKSPSQMSFPGLNLTSAQKASLDIADDFNRLGTTIKNFASNIPGLTAASQAVSKVLPTVTSPINKFVNASTNVVGSLVKIGNLSPNLAFALSNYTQTLNLSDKEAVKLISGYQKVLSSLPKTNNGAIIQAAGNRFARSLDAQIVKLQNIPKFDVITQQVPGLAKALATNASLANRSANAQARNVEALIRNVDSWRKSGASVDLMVRSLQNFARTVDQKNQQLAQAKIQPLTDIKATRKNDFLTASSTQTAFASGTDKNVIAQRKKETLQNAGFTRGSDLQKQTVAGIQAGAKISPTIAARFGPRAPSRSGMSTADILASARVSANKTADSLNKTAKSADSTGSSMKLMGLSMASGMIQGFLPALDESSSGLTQLSHTMLGLITTVTSVAFALDAFGAKLSMQNVLGFLGGKGIGMRNVVGIKRGLQDVGFSAGSSKAIAGTVQAIAKMAGPVLAVVGGLYVLQKATTALVDTIYGSAKQRKEAAIQRGDIAEAGKQARVESNRSTFSTGLFGGAGVGTIVGGLIGGIVGAFGGPAGTVLGVKVGATIGSVVGPIIGGIFAGDFATEAANTAMAFAANSKASKDLEYAQKEAARAATDFSNGTISATDYLKTFASSSKSVQESRKYTDTVIAQSVAGKSEIGSGAILRNLGAYLGGGIFGMETASTRNKRLTQEATDVSKIQRENESKLFESSKEAVNATIRSTLARGGSEEDARAAIKNNIGYNTEDMTRRASSLRFRAEEARQRGDNNIALELDQQADQLFEQARSINHSLENIDKEIKAQKALYNAMNLGLRSATATATGMSATLARFEAGFEVGGSTIGADIEFLTTALSSAAQAMDGADIKSAIGNVSGMLREFGTSEQYIDKFEGNMNAFVGAQQGYVKAFENIKKGVAASEFRNLSPEAFQKQLADELTKGMADGDAKKNLQDVIKGLKLSSTEVDEILSGNLGIIGEKLGEAQQKQLEDIQKIAIERQKAEQILINFTKKRIEAERNFVEAQQQAIDLIMEGRDIQAKYGGAPVSNRERTNAILNRSNVQSNRLGLTALKTGDAGELRRRNQEISNSFRAIEAKRRVEGGLQGKAGVIEDEKSKDLQKAQQEQISTIRALIKQQEDELKIIQEKNKLEKSSLEALTKGDVESFFKQQSAIGARAAIASGDARLQSFYGSEALGMASEDIQRQKEAGVQSLYGQKIDGAGGLGERAASAALSSRGVTDLRSAQMLAGTTGEEEAAKSRLRELGGVLGETGELGAQMANMQVETATVQIKNAEVKFQETLKRGNEAGKETKRIESEAATMNKGGVVYANRGIFVPRGTDTIPAMLTPGEFVVNRNAVRRGNNLQLLKSMNNGSGSVSNSGGAALMATGGIVRYRDQGSQDAESGSNDAMSQFAQALNQFNRELTTNIKSLQNLSLSIKLDATTVNVNLNNVQFLQTVQENIRKEVLSAVIEELGQMSSGSDGKLRKNTGVLNTAPSLT